MNLRSPERLLTRFSAMLVVPAVFCAYAVGHAMSTPSPLSRTTTWQVVVVGAYAVWAALVITVVLTLLAEGLDRILLPRGVPPGRTDALLQAVVAATLALFFLDNLFYIAFDASLRNEDGSPVKLAFVVPALAVGILWARRPWRPSPRAARTVAIATLVASAAAGAVVVVYLGEESDPAPLVREASSPQHNVLIVSADGIRADDMSVYDPAKDTTPFLASRREDFVRFDNAFTNNGNTTGSIVSLLTGRSPQETGVVLAPDALAQEDARLSLPHLLRREGYHTVNWGVPHYADGQAQNLVDAFVLDNGREASAVAAALPLGSGPARWFVEDLVGAAVDNWADALWLRERVNPYGVVRAAQGDPSGDQARLEGVLDGVHGESPFFINSHFMVSHGPVFPLPSTARTGPQRLQWQEEHYYEAIRVFDGYVRQIVGALESASLLDSTILVVTSDHGPMQEARTRVPLLVRFPSGRRAQDVDVNVQRVDVAPTILRALGYEVPSFMEGYDLAEVAAIPARRRIVATTVADPANLGKLYIRRDTSGLRVTDIVCRRYVERLGAEVLARGRVPGSTARC